MFSRTDQGELPTASTTIIADLTEPDKQQTSPSNSPVSVEGESTIGEIIHATTKQLTTETLHTSVISTQSSSSTSAPGAVSENETEAMVTQSLPDKYVAEEVSQQYTDPIIASTSLSASTDDNTSTKPSQVTLRQTTLSSHQKIATTARTNRVPTTSIASSPKSTVAINYATSRWTTSHDALESYTSTSRNHGITTRSAAATPPGYFPSSGSPLGYTAGTVTTEKVKNKKRFSWLRMMALPSFSFECWSRCVADKEFFVTEECQECSQKLCRSKLGT